MTTNVRKQDDSAESTWEGRSFGRRVGDWLSPRRISGIYLWIALIVVYSFTTSTFLTGDTAKTIASEQAITAVIAIGLTVALAAGVFDLSIAGCVGLGNVVCASLMANAGMAPLLAVVLTLLMGMAIGLANGLLVTKVKIDPFIATLGMNSVLVAAVALVSHQQNVVGVPKSFQDVADFALLGIPVPVFYMLALALLVWYVLEWTPVGRRLYATGGGRDVARLAGVPTDAYTIGAFLCSATIATGAGVLVVATIGSGSPLTGPTYLLPAFAAGFLGATQFRPGRFNIWGTVLAVYLLATGVKGLVLMGVDTWVTDLFNGLALIVAVGLSGLERRSIVKKAGGAGKRPWQSRFGRRARPSEAERPSGSPRPKEGQA